LDPVWAAHLLIFPYMKWWVMAFGVISLFAFAYAIGNAAIDSWKEFMMNEEGVL